MKRSCGPKTSMENIDRPIEAMQGACSTMYENPNPCGEFVWIINSWSDRVNNARANKDKEIFSEPFFSHEKGYRNCLSVDILGYVVGIQWCLMHGPFDKHLPWPFKHAVTIDIIHTQTGHLHQSKTMKFADDPNNARWKKPSKTKERNDRLCFLFFTTEEISTMTASQKNDQLMIKCTVHVTP